MIRTGKLTQYIICIFIMGMGAFSWIYNEIIPNGDILGPMFMLYGLWRLYIVYSTD